VDIFVSHSSKDASFVGALVRFLRLALRLSAKQILYTSVEDTQLEPLGRRLTATFAIRFWIPLYSWPYCLQVVSIRCTLCSSWEPDGELTRECSQYLFQAWPWNSSKDHSKVCRSVNVIKQHCGN